MVTHLKDVKQLHGRRLNQHHLVTELKAYPEVAQMLFGQREVVKPSQALALVCRVVVLVRAGNSINRFLFAIHGGIQDQNMIVTGLFARNEETLERLCRVRNRVCLDSLWQLG